MARVLNRPLLMQPDSLNIFISALSDRVGIDRLITAEGEALNTVDMRALAGSSTGREPRSYAVSDGVAILPISGTLVNKSGNMQPYSGMTGYDGIQARAQQALDDDSVHSMLLDIDSPGGEGAGCFEVADFIREASAIKPIYAFAGELATSAAFAIGSAATKLYLPRTGTIGSVGVVVAHKSIEKALDKAGVEVTLIHSGDKKVNGNPYESLPDDVRSEIQTSIDEMREMFASMVAKHRGMKLSAVMATEAGVFNGQAAVDIGFADGIMNFTEVLNMAKKNATKGSSSPALSKGEDGKLLESALLSGAETKVVADDDNGLTDQGAENVNVAFDALFEKFVAEDDFTMAAFTSLCAEMTVAMLVEQVPPADMVIDLCVDAGLDSLASTFIKAKSNFGEVLEQLGTAEQIKDVCKAAGVDDGPILGALGNPVEMVRRALLSAKDEEIDHTHADAVNEPKGKVLDASAIWAKRNEGK